MRSTILSAFSRFPYAATFFAFVMLGVFGATTASGSMLDAYSPGAVFVTNDVTGSGTVGTLFTPITSETVVALGIYAGNDDTYYGPETVGLYLNAPGNASGTLLAQTTVTDTDYLYDGYYWSYLITPVSVVVGNEYTVADFIGNNGIAIGSTPPINNWGTFLGSDYILGGALDFPIYPGNPGWEYYGGDALMGVTPPPVIPEPSTLILFGSGLLGMAGVLRRKFHRG
jgi:hypothetical protein